MESDATKTPSPDGAIARAGGPRRKPRRRAAPTESAPAEPGKSARSTAVEPAPVASAEKSDRTTSPARPPARRAPVDRSRTDSMDRQWRELAGSGRSQVSLSAALRARDAEQPTPEDMAEAEASVAVQHRNWIPTNEG